MACFTVKSNRGVAEEIARISASHTPFAEVGCPDPTCSQHTVGIHTHPSAYQRFGTTRAGAARLRCKACSRLFSLPASPTSRQKRPEVNAEIYRLLINKLPMRRICEVAGIAPDTLYAKSSRCAARSRPRSSAKLN
jgi:transposase-like protein